MSGDAASGGATGAVTVAGAAEGVSSMAGPAGAGAGNLAGTGGMVKSASYCALSGLDGAVTSSLAATPATDPAAAAAAPVPLSSLPASARSGLRGELTHVHLPMPGEVFGQQHQQALGSSFGGQPGSRGLGGMPRVQSVPHLRSYSSDAGSPTLPPLSGGGSGGHAGSSIPGLPSFGSTGYGSHFDQQQQWMSGGAGGMQQPHQHQQPPPQQQQMSAFAQHPMPGSNMGIKTESAYWTPELSYPVRGLPPKTLGVVMKGMCGCVDVVHPRFATAVTAGSSALNPDKSCLHLSTSHTCLRLVLLVSLLHRCCVSALQLPDHGGYQQQPPHHGMRASRSCGNLAFMGSSSNSAMSMGGMQGPGSGMMHSGHNVHSPPGQPYGR